MCITTLINYLLDKWDESRHKSHEEQLKTVTAIRGLQKQKDELANQKAELLKSEAKFREAKAGALEVKVDTGKAGSGTDKGKNKNEKGECTMKTVGMICGLVECVACIVVAAFYQATLPLPLLYFVVFAALCGAVLIGSSTDWQ